MSHCDSSAESTSTKRKASDSTINEPREKRVNMEEDKDIDQNNDITNANPPTTKQTPKSTPEPPDFMSALRDMEERLTNNMQAMLKLYNPASTPF